MKRKVENLNFPDLWEKERMFQKYKKQYINREPVL